MKVLERRLLVLEVITAVAPLLGLLGTVLGLESIFGIISELGLGQAKAFSGGLAEAIRTTVFGLFIAIPSLVAYSYFDKKVDTFVLEMEEYSMHVLNKLYPAKGSDKNKSHDVYFNKGSSKEIFKFINYEIPRKTHCKIYHKPNTYGRYAVFNTFVFSGYIQFY